MEQSTIIARISEVVYHGTSQYGNPHYTLLMIDRKDNVFMAKTRPDAMIGYAISPNSPAFKEWTIHYTRTGNIILDKVSDLKED